MPIQASLCGRAHAHRGSDTYMHACALGGWHMNSLGRTCTHAHRSIHTHTYMFGHRQSMAKYTQTLPLAHPPKAGSPICIQTMHPEPQRPSRVRQHSQSPPTSPKGCPQPPAHPGTPVLPLHSPRPAPSLSLSLHQSFQGSCPLSVGPGTDSSWPLCPAEASLLPPGAPPLGSTPRLWGSREALVLAQEVSAPSLHPGPPPRPQQPGPPEGALLGWGRGRGRRWTEPRRE